MDGLKIRPLSQAEFPQWDELVSLSERGALFHSTTWLKASGEKVVIYGCFRGNELVAGLPFVQSTRACVVKCAEHPPLTPYLGILFRESAGKYVSTISAKKKFSAALAKRLKENFQVIRFGFSPGPADLQPFIWEGFSCSVKYTYILNLDDLERVWEGMDEKRRNDIRRAEKDGIYVEDDAGFGEIFTLVEKTFQRQRMKLRFRAAAFRYNELLQRQGKCRSFLARDKNGVPLAGVHIVWDWNRSYYLLGGYDLERRHHGASALAIWRAIRFTKNELGLREFDFEGSMIPQVEQFFRKFGGRLTPYYSISWMRPTLKVGVFAKRQLARIFSR